MRKIGIAIPTYNRYDQTIASFAQVLDDDRIESIVINDDNSTDWSYEKLQDHFADNPKVFVYRNNENADCYKNKMLSAEKSKSEWLIILDSDNTIDKSYLDALYAIPEWDKKTIYQPEWAKPHFRFTEWSGLTLTKENVAQYTKTHLMTMLNAANHFINREEYLKVWDGSVNPLTSDSIYLSLKWLENDGKILVTPNLQYEHYVDPTGKTGHYNQYSHLTKDFHAQVMKRLEELR